MNEFEAACREWLKGCSCAPEGEPWKCEECTRAFHDRLTALSVQNEPPVNGESTG